MLQSFSQTGVTNKNTDFLLHCPENSEFYPEALDGCLGAAVPWVHNPFFVFSLLPIYKLRFTVFCLGSSMCRFQWDVWHANRAGSGNGFELWLKCSTAEQLEQGSSRLGANLRGTPGFCDGISPFAPGGCGFITPLSEMCFCQLLLQQVLPSPSALWFQLISLVSGGSLGNKMSWYTAARAGHSW